jgi:hypothetical protein
MPQLFAVMRTRGPAWLEARPLEGQADWAAHASFMNALAREGFVVRAVTADEVRSRLAQDPWAAGDLLRVTRVVPWTPRLGSLG